MKTILHVSDLHFGPPYHERAGDALLRIAPTLRPDALVVSGDFTQRAKPEQFAQARDFLDRLPAVPRIVVPGNHDVPLYRFTERLFHPLGEFRKHISQDLDVTLEIDGAILVGLDTTAPHRTITRGRVADEQVEFARAAFAAAAEDELKILVVHHHFVDAPDALNDRSMLRGKRAMTQFVEMGVDMILGGHLHRAFIGNSLDFFFEGPRDRGIILVQSGTTTSRRGRGREAEKNSFNLIDLHEDWFEVTHFLYFEETESFGPMSRHVFPRHGHRLVAIAREEGDEPVVAIDE